MNITELAADILIKFTEDEQAYIAKQALKTPGEDSLRQKMTKIFEQMANNYFGMTYANGELRLSYNKDERTYYIEFINNLREHLKRGKLLDT